MQGAQGQNNSDSCKSQTCCGGRGKMHLIDLAIGESAVITNIKACGLLGRRLRDLGLAIDSGITVTNYAPLGCPIIVSLDGYEISLRRSEAQQIFVAKK